MLIYRVAHRQVEFAGFPAGPYGHKALFPESYQNNLYQMGKEHVCSSTWPVPQHDGIGEVDEGDRCGFDSMTALRRWFCEYWRKELAAMDFGVFVYDSENYRIGASGQAVFDISSADRVACHSLTEGD